VTATHVLARREEIELAPALPERSRGLTRAVLIGAHTGATHTGLTLVELEGGGHVETHLHSFESSFFVLEGEPRLFRDGRGVQLCPNACGAIPVGVPHAWTSTGRARWIEMASPRPRPPDQPPDTFFVGGAHDGPVDELDLRDPRNRHLFFLGEDDMDTACLSERSRVSAPTVSASMATAALL
jgi:mannose-6-phosphate isomerase-like protein (cupin superfamily)